MSSWMLGEGMKGVMVKEGLKVGGCYLSEASRGAEGVLTFSVRIGWDVTSAAGGVVTYRPG